MSHHTRTRVRNLCACTRCAPPDGVLHGTQARAESCDCTLCAAAVATLARLTEYHDPTPRCGVPVMGRGACHRTPGHPLPHVSGFTDRTKEQR